MKQDWKKQSDYSYTEDLDSGGWAWEFIRRSEKYRSAYKNGDQSHAIRWNLKKLYPPDELYHPGIEFQYTNPYPLFFASPGGAWDFLGIEQLEKFPEIRPLEDLPSSIMPYSDDVVIVFQTSQPLKHQIDKAADLLSRYQGQRPFVLDHDIRIGQEPLQRQLRMLDAVLSDPQLTQAEIIKIIHPDKTWPSISAEKGGKKEVGYEFATPSQIASHASDVFVDAKAIADEGYQKFLMRLAQGETPKTRK